MKLSDIINELDSIAPFNLAESWDNVGLLLGDPGQDIRSVLIALDVRLDVIARAEETKADLIITHHPLIIEPMKKFDLREASALKLSKLFRAGISLVAMHTNLDAAEGGVADILAGALGLKDVENHGFFRTGYVKPENLADWVGGLPFANAKISDAGRPVEHVAASPGSGMSVWREAFDCGCDTIVTGDVKFHSAMEACEAGMNVVDLGHFATEAIVLTPFSERLKKLLKGVEITTFIGRDIFITH
jgi:dinuclear metal center YbgI/SA1388 family protein